MSSPLSTSVSLIHFPLLTCAESEAVTRSAAALHQSALDAASNRIKQHQINSSCTLPLHCRTQQEAVLQLRDSHSLRSTQDRLEREQSRALKKLSKDAYSFAHAFALPKPVSVVDDAHTVEYTSASDWVSRAYCSFDSVHCESEQSESGSSSAWNMGVAHMGALVSQFIQGMPANMISYAPLQFNDGSSRSKPSSSPSTSALQWRANMYEQAFAPLFQAIEQQDMKQPTIYTLRISAVHIPSGMTATTSSHPTSPSATSPHSPTTSAPSALHNQTIAFDVLDAEMPLCPRRIRAEESDRSSLPPSATSATSLITDPLSLAACPRFEVENATELQIENVEQLIKVIQLSRNMVGLTPDTYTASTSPTATSAAAGSKQPFYSASFFKKHGGALDQPPAAVSNAAAIASATSANSSPANVATDVHQFFKLLLYVSSNPRTSLVQNHRLLNEFNLVELAAPAPAEKMRSSEAAATCIPHSPNNSFTMQCLAQVHEVLTKKIMMLRRVAQVQAMSKSSNSEQAQKAKSLKEKAAKIHVPFRSCAVTKLLGSTLCGIRNQSSKMLSAPLSHAALMGKKASVPTYTVFLMSLTKNPLQIRLVERSLTWVARFTSEKALEKVAKLRSEVSSNSPNTSGSKEANTSVASSSSSSSQLGSARNRKSFVKESFPLTPHKLAQEEATKLGAAGSSFQPKERPQPLMLNWNMEEKEQESSVRESDQSRRLHKVVEEEQSVPLPSKFNMRQSSRQSSTSPLPPHIEKQLSPIKKTPSPVVSPKESKSTASSAATPPVKSAAQPIVASAKKQPPVATAAADSDNEDDDDSLTDGSFDISFEGDSDFSISSAVSSPGPSKSAPAEKPQTAKKKVPAASPKQVERDSSAELVQAATNNGLNAGQFTPNYHHALDKGTLKKIARKAKSLSPVAMASWEKDGSNAEEEKRSAAAKEEETLTPRYLVPSFLKLNLPVSKLAEVFQKTIQLDMHSGAVDPATWTVEERLRWIAAQQKGSVVQRPVRDDDEQGEEEVEYEEVEVEVEVEVDEDEEAAEADENAWMDADLPLPDESSPILLTTATVSPLIAPITPKSKVDLDDSLSLPSSLPASLVKLVEGAAASPILKQLSPVQTPAFIHSASKKKQPTTSNVSSATKGTQQKRSALKSKDVNVQQQQGKGAKEKGAEVAQQQLQTPKSVPLVAQIPSFPSLSIDIAPSASDFSSPAVMLSPIIGMSVEQQHQSWQSVAQSQMQNFETARSEWSAERKQILRHYKADIEALTRRIDSVQSEQEKTDSPMGLSRRETLLLTQKLLATQQETSRLTATQTQC